MKLKLFASVAAVGVAGAFGAPLSATAQTATDQAPAAAAPAAAPSTAMDLGNGISMSGHVEVGTSINPDSPTNNTNFGQTFTDRDNTFRMNQLMLNVERDLDPKNADYQWGFKFTGMYGTDSRVTHFMNEFDRATTGPYQFDIVELDAQAHIPTFGGGTDVKFGQYPTPLGAEVIDATGNTFYSHSYIFNFGLPFKHTGVLTTTHVNDMIDAWLGLDTGNDDSIGQKGMANNFFPKALFGVGLNNLMSGNLTILALAHIGPETPRFAESTVNGVPGPSAPFLPRTPGADSRVRGFYDIVTTYKWSDAINLVNEINLIHDDLASATGGGMAQYVTYTINDQWSVGARGEVFADQKGTFVCTGTENLDYANGQRGLAPNLAYCSNASNPNGAQVTFGELTIGATYKPPISDKGYLTIRPEVRYDTVVGGGHVTPFNATATAVGTKSSQFTLAVDAIVGF
jgi:hypothetical protein